MLFHNYNDDFIAHDISTRQLISSSQSKSEHKATRSALKRKLNEFTGANSDESVEHS